MRPIEYKADVEFAQALRCVEYRLPKKDGYRTRGFIAATALRYGLIGAAAANHLLNTSESCEEPFILESVVTWPRMVQDHVHLELGRKLPLEEEPLAPAMLAKWSRRPLDVFLPLHRRFYPLEICLQAAVDDFATEYACQITDCWPWWNRRRAMAKFYEDADQSVRYALNFFERRQLDLDEVPEIALLGE